MKKMYMKCSTLGSSLFCKIDIVKMCRPKIWAKTTQKIQLLIWYYKLCIYITTTIYLF